MAGRGRPKKINTSPTPAEKFRCFRCGKDRSATQFYNSTSPVYIKTGKCPICKDCAKDIAERTNELGQSLGLTKESLKLALRYLDKPYIEKLFDASAAETQNDTAQHKIGSLFSAYVKNVSMPNYVGMTYADSDMFKSVLPLGVSPDVMKEIKKTDEQKAEEKELQKDVQQAKKDTLRLLGYDPFENDTEQDRKFLFTKLIRYLDANPEGNEDELKISSIIEIVKLYAQAEKLNNVISKYMQDEMSLAENIPNIKALEETKQKIMSSALALAKDNGISSAHSNKSSKGQGTFTGKLKELKELNLREQEVNCFETEVAYGMSQVADLSDKAIIDQIELSETDFPEMMLEQRKLLTKWKKIASKCEEQARLLLRENMDLKAFLSENGFADLLKENSVSMDTDGGVNDPELQTIEAEVNDVSDEILNEEDEPLTYEIEEDETPELTLEEFESELKEMDGDADET